MVLVPPGLMVEPYNASIPPKNLPSFDSNVVWRFIHNGLLSNVPLNCNVPAHTCV